MKRKTVENQPEAPIPNAEDVMKRREKKRQYNQRYIEKIKTEGRTIHCALCDVHVPCYNFGRHLSTKSHTCNQKIADLEAENESLRKQLNLQI